ncbi:adenine-specific methyltransferase EcoRI family protein [Moraxella haemolytica]|uniref:adenine-specific methyltransferase EcoRI family protein n=1 Tax=Moraxella haemolytica TaxID=2904119 RepID=UPI003AB05460
MTSLNDSKAKDGTVYLGGDFRSKECSKLLCQADIVVTNPPFSLFREYIAQLMAYDKKFLVIGNQNAITYKEIFPLIKENKLWLGNHSVKIFVVPTFIQAKDNIKKGDDGKYYANFGNVCWFTNLTHSKRQDLRTFGDKDRQKAYQAQKGICKICNEYFTIDKMEADHIIPWAKGGKTTFDNCQMLCQKCNRTKSGK